MSKRSIPPPPGDKPAPTAPPPPPGWRHWLWPAALGLMVLAYLFLPAIHTTSPAQLSYSQFIKDAGAGKIKTVTFGSSTGNTTASGDLKGHGTYTTVVPAQPSEQLH